MKTGTPPGLMEGLLIITKWKSNRVTSILENFLISPPRQHFQTKKLLRYIYQPKTHDLLREGLIDPQCLMEEFKALGQDIVPLLKIKLAASLKKTDTKYL